MSDAAAAAQEPTTKRELIVHRVEYAGRLLELITDLVQGGAQLARETFVKHPGEYQGCEITGSHRADECGYTATQFAAPAAAPDAEPTDAIVAPMVEDAPADAEGE